MFNHIYNNHFFRTDLLIIVQRILLFQNGGMQKKVHRYWCVQISSNKKLTFSSGTDYDICTKIQIDGCYGYSCFLFFYLWIRCERLNHSKRTFEVCFDGKNPWKSRIIGAAISTHTTINNWNFLFRCPDNGQTNMKLLKKGQQHVSILYTEVHVNRRNVRC